MSGEQIGWPLRRNPPQYASGVNSSIDSMPPEMTNAGAQRRPETARAMLCPEQIVQRSSRGAYIDDGTAPSPAILTTTQSAAREALNQFCKDFLAPFKTANVEVQTAMKVQMMQRLSVPIDAPIVDLRHLVQACLCQLLFADFENSSFGIRRAGQSSWQQEHSRDCFQQFLKYKVKGETVAKLLRNELNETHISDFCTKKFEMLLTLDAGGGFFEGALSTNEISKKHLNHPFYRSFLGAAVSFWLLQRLASSFEDRVMPIYPEREHRFDRNYMISSVPGMGDDEEDNDYNLAVLLTVFPGFRVNMSVVKTWVYLVESPYLPYISRPPDNEKPLYVKRADRYRNSQLVTSTTNSAQPSHQGSGQPPTRSPPSAHSGSWQQPTTSPPCATFSGSGATTDELASVCSFRLRVFTGDAEPTSKSAICLEKLDCKHVHFLSLFTLHVVATCLLIAKVSVIDICLAQFLVES
uniref:Uncharacterized protein n=1 Tax=Physcomitrium patens TaxID=3218 RepID=A0A7I4AMN7_PHYPA